MFVFANGTLRAVLPSRPDVTMYHRGRCGWLSEARAKVIMPALRDWVAGGSDKDNNNNNNPGGNSNAAPASAGRCFFKSTTSGSGSLKAEVFQAELRTIRSHAYRVGCSYLDYGYLTETFAALDMDEPAATERKTVFLDSVRVHAPARCRSFSAQRARLSHIGSAFRCVVLFCPAREGRFTTSPGCTRSSTRCC
jgi:hypothetical protein